MSHAKLVDSANGWEPCLNIFLFSKINEVACCILNHLMYDTLMM